MASVLMIGIDPLFEQAVNLVRRYAQKAVIAFNTSGGDSVEAARRWL